MQTIKRTRKGERTKRDCPHNGRHKHGTRDAYSRDKCRCDPCTDAKAIYFSKRSKLMAYGRWDPGFIDAAPIREHLERLKDEHGMGYRQIARTTGLQQKAVYLIRTGASTKVKRSTAEAILAVSSQDAAPDTIVDGTGSRRRIQALVAIGWSVKRLCPMIGMTHNSVDWLLAGHGLKRRNAISIRAVYDELWDQSPPMTTKGDKVSASRTRNWAAKQGWAIPLAWDDETIDDPAAVPDGTRTSRRATKPIEDVIEDLDWLRRTGTTPAEAATRIGLSHGTLVQAVRRSSQTHLYSWITKKDAA